MQHGGIACGMFMRKDGRKEEGWKSSLKWYRLAKEDFGQDSKGEV